jgi:hypothetical protein
LERLIDASGAAASFSLAAGPAAVRGGFTGALGCGVGTKVGRGSTAFFASGRWTTPGLVALTGGGTNRLADLTWITSTGLAGSGFGFRVAGFRARGLTFVEAAVFVALLETLVLATLLMTTGLLRLSAARFFGFFITSLNPGGNGVNGKATIRTASDACN